MSNSIKAALLLSQSTKSNKTVVTILTDLLDGVKCSDIACKLKVSKQYVYQIRDKFNLK